jgi:RsiW-degrading membrane proteinase PrsW (M82 family)
MPGYPYGWYPPMPPRAPGETYRKVLSIITIVATSLLLLGGLGGIVIIPLLGTLGSGQDLSVMNLLVTGTLAALAGGGAGLYHAIRALTRHQSAPFSLPSFWVLLALTFISLGAGIVLFATNQPTGTVEMIEPLVALSGVLPSMTVLALGLQRLRPQVTWRHATLALTNGATLAVAVAAILELVLTLVLLGAASVNINLSNLNPNSSFGITAILVLVSLIAPLVEETAKQISGFFLLPRLKGPQEAFLIGLAAGVGFAIVESSGYIGTAQADWVGIALGRVGAGLLHGMGAAMAGVGWYYLIRGKGYRRRWLIGFSCLAYAYIQHAIFNGCQVLLTQVPAFQDWHVDFFGLVFDVTSVAAGILYLVILLVMMAMIRWLRQAAPGGSNIGANRQPTPNVSLATYSSKTDGPPAGAASPNMQGVGEPGNQEWRRPV